MLIDWFTVGAQALNFAVLVWLMKRFLYQPVLNAIDAREKHIADQLRDADATKTEATRERDEFREKNARFEAERAALFASATRDAEAEGRRLTDEAATAADEAAGKQQDARKDEAAALDQALGVRVRQEVFAIARETLTGLATVTLEAQVSDVFIERLRALNGVDRDRLAAAIGTTRDGALLRSAFALPQPQQAAIGQALNDVFAADVALRFETASDLVAGIELTVNGQRLEWNIARHLASLDQRVDEPVA